MRKKKDKKEIIRSTSTSLKFSNANKLKNLFDFIQEYKKVVVITIDYLWNMEEIPSLLPKEITNIVSQQTWLTARAIQAACKQASGIVRGTRTKQKKRLNKINEFKIKGMFRKARKLQRFYDKVKISKPKIENVCPELDERFVSTNFGNATSFDGWITLTCLGKKLKIVLPFRKTKHFNEMLERGKIKNGIRISRYSVTFNFTLPPVVFKTEGKVVGLDKGIKSLYSINDNQESGNDIHGWDLDKILKKMSKKVKGSKAFKKCQQHRKNFIHWCLNQIDFSNIKTLNVEKLKDLRRGKKTGRYLSHWTYTIIKNKLDNLSLEYGVRIRELNPTYTSQRCSKCGWTRKKNRNGKKFVCEVCDYTDDADHNASVNISLDLPEISKEERLLQKNRNGFYWHVVGQEPIVPAVLKASRVE